LEQLVAEWYEYQGYFVRRNVLVGPRLKGGYECELDVIAFNPERKHLVHIEPSMDTNTWAERERRYTKKFAAGRKYIPHVFKGLILPNDIEQIAVLTFAAKKNHVTLGGGKLVLVEDLLSEIFEALKTKRIGRNSIPEHWTVLRSFQFVAECQTAVYKTFGSGG
jgi:hypothetical protein